MVKLLACGAIQGLIPGLTATISDIGYLLLPCRNMAELSLKWSKPSIKQINQPSNSKMVNWRLQIIQSQTWYPLSLKYNRWYKCIWTCCFTGSSTPTYCSSTEKEAGGWRPWTRTPDSRSMRRSRSWRRSWPGCQRCRVGYRSCAPYWGRTPYCWTGVATWSIWTVYPHSEMFVTGAGAWWIQTVYPRSEWLVIKPIKQKFRVIYLEIEF